MRHTTGLLITGTTKGQIVYWYSDKSPLLGLLAQVAYAHNGRPGVIRLRVQVATTGKFRGRGEVISKDVYELANLGEAIHPDVVREATLLLDDAMREILKGFYQSHPDASQADELPARVRVHIVGRLF